MATETFIAVVPVYTEEITLDDIRETLCDGWHTSLKDSGGIPVGAFNLTVERLDPLPSGAFAVYDDTRSGERTFPGALWVGRATGPAIRH